jgi:hypothetical protein
MPLALVLPNRNRSNRNTKNIFMAEITGIREYLKDLQERDGALRGYL